MDDDLKQLFDSIRDENRRHFDSIRDEDRRTFENGRKELNDRCGQLIESVAALGEKLDRRFSALKERMERGFAETQALLKFPGSTP